MAFFNRPVIKFNKIHDHAIFPSKAHTGSFQDAAYDLFMCYTPSDVSDKVSVHPSDFSASITIGPGQRVMVPTGIRAILPKGYWAKFHERSGLASKGIHVMGGVIDSAYTGEWKVILYNSNPDFITIDSSKAIAQFTLEKITDASMIVIDALEFNRQATNRSRGENGFGSTDEKTKS